ncbi:MAG: tRNA (guanosine(46)-N7)-methyltransferase TrmB [Verrucomicrobiota bacterium]
MSDTISESYQRELDRQAQRKAQLREECEQALVGCSRIFFEAGCGHGHWLNSYAEAHPKDVCVGVDLISLRIRKALDKRKKRSLDNLHFFKADLNEFLEVLPEHIRFDQTLMLFPDPWPKARHHRRRMVQTEFLDVVARRTDPGGRFLFRSDDAPYSEWTVELLEAHEEWEIAPDAEWPHEKETYFQSLMDRYQSVIALRR